MTTTPQREQFLQSESWLIHRCLNAPQAREAASHRNAELAVRQILARGALPLVLGCDHAVNIPCIRAFADQPPIHLIQIDAHLDFVDVRHGVREGHGNPMRRAAGQGHVTGLTQLGIRNVSSTAREGYEDARRRGSQIRSVRQCRKLGTEGVLALIPEGARYYVTIDIDAFDPSIAPGTGTPSHGARWGGPDDDHEPDPQYARRSLQAPGTPRASALVARWCGKIARGHPQELDGQRRERRTVQLDARPR